MTHSVAKRTAAKQLQRDKALISATDNQKRFTDYYDGGEGYAGRSRAAPERYVSRLGDMTLLRTRLSIFGLLPKPEEVGMPKKQVQQCMKQTPRWPL